MFGQSRDWLFAVGVVSFIDEELVFVEPPKEPLPDPEPLAALAMAAPPPTAAPVRDRAASVIQSRFRVRTVCLLSRVSYDPGHTTGAC
jgi:hypothetical protein